MRLAFLGTPQFAVPSLQALHRAGHTVAVVVTQPDRPAGRGLSLRPSPVKQYAQELGLPVEQPEKLGPEQVERLLGYGLDVAVTAAFGQKIPPGLLHGPRFGCVNVHPSLLPRYRGAAPIQRALMDGCTSTGVTIMQMNEGWDSGDILLQKEVQVGPRETAGQLHDRLAELGAELLVQVLELLEQGRLQRRPQDEALVTWAPRLRPEDQRIHWWRSAQDLANQIRALNPWPGSYTLRSGRRLLLWETGDPAAQPFCGAGAPDPSAVPGQVVALTAGAIGVACGAGQDGGACREILWVTRLQPEGRRQMSAAEFVRGHRPQLGERWE
ncbi:MAG: methionyl-tRNA formyltransferase [Firmicutes bacterium]|nr:methionyl-tRNA formyltransferase [Bacillota bacterium]